MGTELARANVIESVVIGGDLSKLTPEQRVEYYQAVCRSIGLNPLTKPFDYISLNGKLTLYARKDAADQLRSLNNISIEPPAITFEGEWIIVTVAARDKTGRADSDIGVVNKKDMQGNFGNALMKAVTKAKRRVTLSICGLGWLDETEVETIPDARPVVVDEQTGEIVQPAAIAPPSSLMTLEMAISEVGSDGVKYGDKDTKTLANMANALAKKLKDNGYSPEEREEKQRKLDACRVILADRQT